MRWLGPDGVPGDAYPELRARAVLSVAASEKLFQDTSKSWADVLRDAEGSKPQSFGLPVTAKLHEVSRDETISSPNVIAVLPGSGGRKPPLMAEVGQSIPREHDIGIVQLMRAKDLRGLQSCISGREPAKVFTQRLPR